MPKKDYIIKDFSGGLNEFDHKGSIENNEATYLQNLKSVSKGSLISGTSIGNSSISFADSMFEPGQGLFKAQSDFGYNHDYNLETSDGPPGAKIAVNHASFDVVSSWAAATNGSGATITITADRGIIYGNGGGDHENHEVKYNVQNVYPDRWYSFYMMFVNETRNTLDAWDGALELHLGNNAAATREMLPSDYVKASYASGTSMGGIFISAQKENTLTDKGYSAVTSTTEGYQVISTGVFKTPPEAVWGVSSGYIRLYGHINGDTASAPDTWTLNHFQVIELPYDSTLTTNTQGEIYHIGGHKLQRWDGAAVKLNGFQNTKVSDSSLSSATDTTTVTVTSSKPDMFQADQLIRVSDGDFSNSVDNIITGALVKNNEESFGGVGSTITSGATTHTITSDKYGGASTPATRLWHWGQQNPNTVFPRQTIYNNGDLSPLVVYEHAGAADEELTTIDFGWLGQVVLGVGEPNSGGEDIDEDWKKNWVFGISYKLTDNSVTNVFTGKEQVTTTANVIHCIITDPGYDSGRTDGTHTGKTLIMASSSNITGVTLEVKNDVLVGILIPTTAAALNNEAFTIAAADMGGGSVVANGVVITTHTGNMDVNMTTWTENPRFSLQFRQDVNDNRNALVGTHGNTYTVNQYEEAWYKTGRVGGMGSSRWDPRIVGFIIWGYALEDISPDSDVPWSPIFEVNLDNKKFVSYTYDNQERDLINARDKEDTERYNGMLYRTPPDFSAVGTYNHDNPPVTTSLTYNDAIGYRSDSNFNIRWKASTIANGRTVVANITRNGVHFPDRVAISYPGTYDVFPVDFAGDITLNDGEDVIALASFQDKVLLFKTTICYLLNFTDPDDFFVEGDYRYYGIHHNSHVVTSDYGITWWNHYSGIIHYDGNELQILNSKKIPNESITDIASYNTTFISPIGFEPISKELHIRNDAIKNNTGTHSDSGLCYSFLNQNFYRTYLFYQLGSNKDAASNFVSTNDGTLIFLITDTTGTTYPHNNTGASNSVKQLNPRTGISGTYITAYASPEIDFGDIGLKKQVYKIKIKYKMGGNGSSGAALTFKTNGNTTSYTTSGIANDNSGNYIMQDFIPTTASEADNIYSIQLLYASSSHSQATFVLDSMVIVYRVKHAK